MRLQSQTDLTKAKNLTAIIYGLYAASFIFGITALAAIIINYVKRDSVAGTYLESHFRWQIRTFWFGLLWGVLGFALTFVGVGLILLGGNVVWMLYRLIKGWLNLNDEKSMYA